MFTGIITAIGEVRSLTQLAEGADMRIVVATPWQDAAEIPLGASIANSGVCLTVIDRGADWFAVEASAETLSKTTLGGWKVGARINLERALRMGDELGGHVVSGHVDGVGRAISTAQDHGSIRFAFEVPGELARFIAPKGSVAINGVSLTVNEVDGTTFGVNIIPHTAAHTTFGALAVGDAVNIEIDMLARYVARLREFA
jgi:riboflavin synthase